MLWLLRPGKLRGCVLTQPLQKGFGHSVPGWCNQPAKFEPRRFPALLYLRYVEGASKGQVFQWTSEFFISGKYTGLVIHRFQSYLISLGGSLWRTFILLGETDCNQGSGSLASTGTEPVLEAPTIANVEFTPMCGFPFYTFYVLKEPFTNSAVGVSVAHAWIVAQCILPFHTFMFKWVLGQRKHCQLPGKIIRILCQVKIVYECERIIKTDVEGNIDYLDPLLNFKTLFTFCRAGWKFIQLLPSARHMHIAMQMDPEKHYFSL